MDFEKIKPAVEEIALDDIQKAKILASCKNKKRKINYKPVIGIVSAAAAITLVLASPGFLFRATKADDASAENLADSIENDGLYNEYADEDYNYKFETMYENSSASLTSADLPLFKAEEFYEIYTIVPYEFSSLVNAEEYKIWSDNITADGGMAMVQFVLDFDISREDFENALILYNERTFADISDIPVRFEADVIYSFDREKIDSFYKK